MKHHSLTYYLTLLLVCSCLWSSCKKFVDAGSPKAELTTDKVFADSTGATAAVTGIYITPGIGSGSTTVAAGLSADELSTTAQGSYAEFFANNIRPANSQNRSLWVSTYQQLYQANACIEGIMASPGLSDQQKKRLTAEARFIRAFLLFNLTGLFGPVPLVTMTDYRETRTLPRAATTAVYAQVVADLQFAQANLSSQGEDTRRGNYYAATALLARVYLYLGQYAQAAAEASKVIDSGHFSLMAEPNQVFLATSKEAIWRLVPVTTGRETTEGSLFVPSSASAVPAFVLSEQLRAAFAPTDKRAVQWIAGSTIGGRVYYYPFKYKKVFSSGAPTEHYMVLRLAEQYLIRAECRGKTGNIAGAIADLHVIQKRANAALYAGEAAGLPDAIELERKKELFCEWGHRWADLKRTGRADVVLSPVKAGWKPAAALFPVPQEELDANPYLDQNPGY